MLSSEDQWTALCLRSLDFIYCTYEFILLTHNVCVLAEKSELGSKHCAAVVVFSSVYIGVCLPKVKWKIMKWEVCTSLQLLLQWYVVKWRSVFCSMSPIPWFHFLYVWIYFAYAQGLSCGRKIRACLNALFCCCSLFITIYRCVPRVLLCLFLS